MSGRNDRGGVNGGAEAWLLWSAVAGGCMGSSWSSWMCLPFIYKILIVPKRKVLYLGWKHSTGSPTQPPNNRWNGQVESRKENEKQMKGLRSNSNVKKTNPTNQKKTHPKPIINNLNQPTKNPSGTKTRGLTWGWRGAANPVTWAPAYLVSLGLSRELMALLETFLLISKQSGK